MSEPLKPENRSPAAETAPAGSVHVIPREPFFRLVDWSAFWTALLLALLVYGLTLAPTVTLEDSGELAVGADHLGVPHPPGYPIWTIITWVFTRVFCFVQFRGQPNPAWAVAFASAVFGALACGLTALLLCRSSRDILQSIQRTTEVIGERTERWICWCGGVAASLVFAFSPVNWSQSVIVEVYALNAFFLVTIMFLAYVWMRRPDEPLRGITGLILGIALTCLAVMGSRLVLQLRLHSDFLQVGIHYVLGYLLLLILSALVCYVWRRRPGDRLLYLMSLTFGLGLTNYQVLLLLLVSLAVVVMVRDMPLFRDFVIAGIPFALYYALASTGLIQDWLGPGVKVTYLGVIHPTHPLTYACLACNFAVIALAYFFLPNGQRVAPAILCLELGLAVYTFMPLASETNPPINWGYPRTWEGFVHAISRGQYEQIVPTNLFSAQFVLQVGDYVRDLRSKFTLPVAILGILPFTAWSLRLGRRRVRALYATVALAGLAVVLILIEEVAMPTGGEWLLLSRAYTTLIVAIGVFMAIGGAVLALGEIVELARKVAGRAKAAVSERITAALLLLGIAAATGLVVMKVVALVSRAGLGTAERTGLMVLLLTPVAALVLVHYLMRSDARLALDFDRDDQKWILATLSGFMVMSVILVALASPKGDIQDEFIKRVMFISSHALFSLWIGYGLILCLATVDTVFRGNRAVTWAGLAIALLLPAIPLLQDGYNRELLRTDGGAEQNGHDFGWQFGNYQLRGAEAISEELAPGEEPLPNPSYPPAMGPRAVFFGGTDPGRFVPTYMIYSAAVRPDVHLITQNALADNTYLSVMRDLYGDSIWIPSLADGNGAFRRYIEDLRAGRTAPSADIRIEGGRVSIQGVGGVMLINGILAQMIFEHNKDRHAFYVEESYAIAWMYPYLTPHGLIMQINPAPLPSLPPQAVHDDMDFWDWYVRRLTGNPRFLRDTMAKKSFSKLRSAIAGLYVSRGMIPEGEHAFLESIRLYPLSPEANFRLADLYLRSNRPDDAIRIMAAYSRQDPNNGRAAAFVQDLKARSALDLKRRELERRVAPGKATAETVLELAETYRALDLAEPFRALTLDVIARTGLPAHVYLRAAQLSAEAQQAELVETALSRYIELVPDDLRALIDLGAIRFALGKQDGAFLALRQAIRGNREEAMALIDGDARFTAVRSSPAFRMMMAP